MITGGGEVMLKGPTSHQGWILPLCRIVRELGAVVVWDALEFKLVFPCNREVLAREEDGLRYVCQEDLDWIRKGLLHSNYLGRPRASKTAGPIEVKCQAVNIESEEKDPERSILAGSPNSREEETWLQWSGAEWQPDPIWLAKVSCERFDPECIECKKGEGSEKKAPSRSNARDAFDLDGRFVGTPSRSFWSRVQVSPGGRCI